MKDTTQNTDFNTVQIKTNEIMFHTMYFKAMSSASHRLYYLNAVFTVSQTDLRTCVSTNIFFISI